MIGNILRWSFLTILMSFYLFPFEFIFLPGVNTKMMLAVFGIVFFLYEAARKRSLSIESGFIWIISLGVLVSLIGQLSMAINNTEDQTYATYFVSMMVWLGGAYAVLFIIRKIYGYLSVELVSNYLIAVCICQCISALLIEYVPFFRNFVDSFALGVGFGKDFKDLQGDRLYGIGAMLDVAGQRFSAILVIIAVLSVKVKDNFTRLWAYLIAFIFISVVGNMIGRTTTVGVVISLAYWGLTFFKTNNSSRKPIWVLIIAACVTIPVMIYFYNHNQVFHDKIKFGFEGFFSLYETGQWKTHSNDILANMYKLPESTHTWLIGDGYFANPRSDPYYIGYNWKGFYQGTDVGYLRFIYYFGIFGLLAFSLYFIKVGDYLYRKFPNYGIMFLLIVLLNFIIWFKVSSDLFSVLAIYMLIPEFDDNSIAEIPSR